MIPKPFCFNKSRIKAIVIGTDPTNYSVGKGKSAELYFAFGIGQNPNYFRGILDNLNILGINLEDVYIRNLLPGYQKKETGQNKLFLKDARENAMSVSQELNKDISVKNIPVFLTAYVVYLALIDKREKIFTAKELYNLQTSIPIPSSQNLLSRPLIPLFRHADYHLNKNTIYRDHLIKIINYPL